MEQKKNQFVSGSISLSTSAARLHQEEVPHTFTGAGSAGAGTPVSVDLRPATLNATCKLRPRDVYDNGKRTQAGNMSAAFLSSPTPPAHPGRHGHIQPSSKMVCHFV